MAGGFVREQPGPASCPAVWEGTAGPKPGLSGGAVGSETADGKSRPHPTMVFEHVF
ncbi:hypothetical protein ACFFX0_03375 [Citricoccus parietis]|uniref:Uncharacterized protein n=1 Tax=Citricoccus parietis TaxID=592307 RepID=A0ABV5FUC1_9MICC